MPWQHRYFKGKKVWAKTGDDGGLAVDDGRVPMKYDASDDAKIYRANPANLSGPIEEAKSAQNDGPSRRSSTSSGTKPARYQIQPTEPATVSTTVPEALAAHPPPDDGVVEVYTDGACSGNPGPCGYGVLMRQSDTYREISQYLGEGTNNIAELSAIKAALEHVDEPGQPVRIYSDSRYSIGVLADGWKAKANRQLILGIRELLETFDDVKLVKVKGHAGHPLNERADDLATATLDGHR